MQVLENAFDDWMKVAELTEPTDELFVSTPYITGEVLESVFEISPSHNKFLITELKLQNVLTGSLDLRILENLLLKGVKIFHLRGLHAKVLVSPHGLVLGSQNFTTAGSMNSELSVLTSDKNAIADTLKWVTKTIADGSPITDRVLRVFQNYIEKIPSEDALSDLLRLFEDQDKDFDQWLQSAFALRHGKQSKQSDARQIGWIREVFQYEQVDEWGYPQYITFKKPNSELTLNSFFDPEENRRINLLHRQRYLLINKTNDALYFAPANKQQIGKFADGVVRTAPNELLDLPDDLKHVVESVSVDLNNPRETSDHHNLSVTVHLKSHDWDAEVQSHYFFDGGTISIITSPSCSKQEYQHGGDRQALLEACERWASVLPSQLTTLIFTPFQFQNSRTGFAPHRLFSETKMELSLRSYLDPAGSEFYFYMLK